LLPIAAYVTKSAGVSQMIAAWFARERKVRASQDNTWGNAPPPQGEEQWNRKNVQGVEPSTGNGRLRGSRWSENSQTQCEARSNRKARSIERYFNEWSAQGFRVRSLERLSN